MEDKPTCQLLFPESPEKSILSIYLLLSALSLFSL